VAASPLRCYKVNSDSNIVFLRYWGGYFKSKRQVEIFAGEFLPLVQRGWQCYLVLKEKPEDASWLEELLALGIKIECLPRPRRNFDWRCVLRTFALAKRVRATVFACDNMHTSPLIGAWLAGVPGRFWTKRSMNSDFEECRKPSWKERMAVSVRLSCFLCTRVIAVSKAVKDELVSLRIPSAKIIIRNNPRRFGSFKPSLDRETLRKTWGCGVSDTVVLSIGRAEPVKGWDILIRAFAKIAPKAPKATLVLVGSYAANAEKQFYASLLDVVKQNRLETKVVFHGYMRDVQSAYQAADIFVLPSRSEGCSSAPVEALEARVPCIATRVGHAAEVIQHGVNGFLVQRCDVNDMAEALLQLTQSEKLRAEFARNAILPPAIVTMKEYAEQFARDYEQSLPGMAKSSQPLKFTETR